MTEPERISAVLTPEQLRLVVLIDRCVNGVPLWGGTPHHHDFHMACESVGHLAAALDAVTRAQRPMNTAEGQA